MQDPDIAQGVAASFRTVYDAILGAVTRSPPPNGETRAGDGTRCPLDPASRRSAAQREAQQHRDGSVAVAAVVRAHLHRRGLPRRPASEPRAHVPGRRRAPPGSPSSAPSARPSPKPPSGRRTPRCARCRPRPPRPSSTWAARGPAPPTPTPPWGAWCASPPRRGRRLRRPPPALAHGAGRRDGARLPLRPHRDHPAPRGTRRAAPRHHRRRALPRGWPDGSPQNLADAVLGERGSALLLAGYPYVPALRGPAAAHLLQTARERGVRTVLSLSPVALGGPGQPLVPADLEPLLPHVDLLCGGAPELRRATRRSNAQDAARALIDGGARAVLSKRGTEGAALFRLGPAALEREDTTAPAAAARLAGAAPLPCASPRPSGPSSTPPISWGSPQRRQPRALRLLRGTRGGIAFRRAGIEPPLTPSPPPLRGHPPLRERGVSSHAGADPPHPLCRGQPPEGADGAQPPEG